MKPKEEFIMIAFTKRIMLGCLTLASISFGQQAFADTPHPTAVSAVSGPMIPDLPWEKCSDWIDVKTDVTPAAKGDGIADDTAAIQAAFKMVDWNSKIKTIYLPAGTYRITKTLELGGEQCKSGIVGGTIIGNGRSTRIAWDGEPGGVMLKSLGYTHSSYVGFVLDGRGKAATGLLHAGNMYETDMLYRHVAFLNFTGEAVSIGRKHAGNLETAEVFFDNCLFDHCAAGIVIDEYNDYDNLFAGCEFRDCGQGIVSNYGGCYIRDCHFERSTVRDILLNSGPSSGVRRCTSLDSKTFLEYNGPVEGISIQDCRIDGWSDRRGAILLRGAPVVMFDCVIGNPSSALLPEELRERFPIWPVKIIGKETQRLIISNNIITVKGKQEPLSRKNVLGESALGFECGRVYEIPAGERKGSLKSAKQSFLKTSVPVPSKIFDAKRDFGAKGDGQADDSEAIQKAIDAAKARGNDSMAYLPGGTYRITKTLELTGSNYRLGGAGECSNISWGGAKGGTTVHVSDPDYIIIEGLAVGGKDNDNDILQTSTGAKPSFVCYDKIFVFSPVYNEKYWGATDYSDKKGLRLEGLKKDDTVLVKYIRGNFHCVNSAAATILCDASFNTGHIVIEGKGGDRSGFTGFLTKLGVCENPTLTVKDSNSITFGDLYMESDIGTIKLEGSDGDPAGRVTIQGVKFQNAIKENPAMVSNNYHGEFTLGPDMLIMMSSRFEFTGNNPLSIAFMGVFTYAADPVFKAGPNVKFHFVGNEGSDGKTPGFDCPPSIRDTDLNAAIPQISRSLDDFRRLGEIDLMLNYPETLK